jgi:DNA invertase Pin-like site-specific DNA recombinase
VPPLPPARGVLAVRFVLYARASTKDKQTPEHQLAELQQHARLRGWEVVAELIERESGRRDDRPVWAHAVELVLTGKADGVASTELSRFGRSTRHLLEVGAAFQASRAHLVCTRQPIDTTTPVGRLVFVLLAAVAEFESDLTRERVRAGVAYAKAKRGGAWGRQRETPSVTVLKAARDLRRAGLSWRRVSARLYAAGHGQPARERGRSAHPRRPWPIGTLRDALSGVELPPEPGPPNPPADAG